jgi:hypothetical protein
MQMMFLLMWKIIHLGSLQSPLHILIGSSIRRLFAVFRRNEQRKDYKQINFRDISPYAIWFSWENLFFFFLILKVSEQFLLLYVKTFIFNALHFVSHVDFNVRHVSDVLITSINFNIAHFCGWFNRGSNLKLSAVDIFINSN